MKMRAGSWKSAAAAILVASALLRLAFLHYAGRLEGDPLLYGNIALNLLRHHVYSFVPAPGPYTPTLIRLPGYPLFLAACFALFGVANYHAVLLVQIAIDLLASAVLAGIALRLFGSRAALLCLGLAALCPFTANYTAIPLTETLTLATIVAAYAAFERWQASAQPWNPWLWAVGSALSASLLLRPEQGILSAVLLAAMAYAGLTHPPAPRQRTQQPSLFRLAPAFAAALCVVLPLVPWTLRNWETFHVVQPLAPRSATDPGEAIPRGFQHWYRTWAIDFASSEEVYWNYDGSPIRIGDLPSRAFDSPAQRAETAALLEDYNQTTNPTPAFNARFEAIAQQRIHGHRLRYSLWLPAARLANMLLRPRTELMQTQLRWWDWRSSPGQAIFAFLYTLLNLAYLAAAALGWWRWRRAADRSQHILLWSIAAFTLLRCALLLTLDNSEPRYTLEFFPIGILCASALAGQTRPHRPDP